MDINSVPNRASDAGPDSSTEVLGWRECLDAAADAIRDAGRVYRDDINAERGLRIEQINEAIQYLQRALVQLPNQVIHIG